MKIRIILTVVGLLMLIISCKKKEEIICPDGFSGDNCEIEDECVTQSLVCLNGGICLNGLCDCPNGFSGNNCEIADPNRVQEFLDSGNHNPFDLYLSGIPLDSFYGKFYEGGLIFHLDTINGGGLIAAPVDQSNGTQWGCMGTSIFGTSLAIIGTGEYNTNNIVNECSEVGIAARVCYDLKLNDKTDWYLPSIDELKAMNTNLYVQGIGEFNGEAYWSSTQASNTIRASELFAWIHYMGNPAPFGTQNKDYNHFFVRAIRTFEP